MKGVFESRRPKPKYTKIWDVGEVLKHLSTFYPYDKLALKDLTYKVLMLILLVSSQRGQTVHSLDLLSTFVWKRTNKYLTLMNT